MTSQADPNIIFKLAADFVIHTNRHVFLTGKAGTGKTTFLKHITAQSVKNTVVVAPTGVAAINAGGVTLHSFFQLPFGSFIPGHSAGFGFSLSPSEGTDLNTLLRNIRVNRNKRRLFEELELLIIDEVSMLRADLLDAIDGILRHFRRNPGQPFGGVQVLYIGDMYQLPPVVKEEEWALLSRYYRSLFFFDARVMEEAMPLYVELEKVYRQSDAVFIRTLNNIRNSTLDEDDIRLLNRHYDPYFHPEPEDGYIILTSHNYKADRINKGELARLHAEVHRFDAELNGDFNEHALPAERELSLKEGAQIMFIRNDKGDKRRYYNGRIAHVSRIKGSEIYVRFPNERDEMLLEQETWRNIRYKYNEQADRIEEEELGSFRQYPVRLAWAITIHKSQGLTFEKAIIDAGESFAPGQVYVALSRLVSLGGLVLSSQITPAALHTDERITGFSSMGLSAEILQEELAAAQRTFLEKKLSGSYSWTDLQKQFRDFHSEFDRRRLPDQEQAVAWSYGMRRELDELAETGDKFMGQLQAILPVAHRDGYHYLLERMNAATHYFLGRMDTLTASWKAHYDSVKLKARVKKYLNELSLLQAALSKKTQEIREASLLAHGLAGGEDPGHLLQQASAKQKEIRTTEPEETETAKVGKESSGAISLKLLQEGKSPEEIAEIRGLSRSTVEGHLLNFIPTGEVLLAQLVSKENELAIRNAVLHSGQRQAKVIREALGSAFTFTEIKAVLCHMEKEKEL